MRLKTKGCGHEASEFITLLGGALQDDRRRSQAAFAAWKDSSQKSTIAPRPGYAGTGLGRLRAYSPRRVERAPGRCCRRGLVAADQKQEHHGVQACWPGSLFKGADLNGTR
jgi:hypothetical protein